MVGIVIVSHSKMLAEGVKELANQMSQNKVAVITAGGLEDTSSPIGTDPFKIKDAIEALSDSNGILVLMDIGSAVMNAELALDLVDERLKHKTLLCEAPLVEGAIAAVAQAMTGADIEAVANEAKHSLLGKQTLLKPVEEQVETDAFTDVVGKEIKITVPNQLGLHARPSVKLIELVNKFDVTATVSTKNKPFVAADSISQVSTLGAKKGDILTFRVKGKQADDLEIALKGFVKQNFGDPVNTIIPQSNKKVSKHVNNKLAGIGVSNGIAIGHAKLLKNMVVNVKKEKAENTLLEISKLKMAIEAVLNNIIDLQQKTMALYGKEDAEIFDFHIFMLNDSKTLDKVEQIINNDCLCAEYAWYTVFSDLENKYLEMEDAYLKERAADIVEIRNKVISDIQRDSKNDIILTEPAILVVDEIGPAQTLSLDTDKVLGIISMHGGETSHATILARSLGIPAITAVGKAISDIKENDMLAMNGSTGDIVLKSENPKKINVLILEKEKEDRVIKERFIKAKQPAISNDGVEFKILANVSSPKEAKLAFVNGAEGIGLYRTEFLFMNRESAPSEEEQYSVYKQLCENMKGLPITIRTLDIGGDKHIPYMGIGEENNPFLGLRGIRYCLQNIPLFKTQLRALCRISAAYQIKIMYPMVGIVEEVLSANKILREVQNDLKKQNIPFDKNMQVGIMVEVPSVLFLIPQLAKEINFLSIGTNDLTQYLLALDRENTNVSKYFSALHPAVLSAVQTVIKLAKENNLEVSLCGELARNQNATKLLSRIGLRNFSMSSPAIPDIKEVIRNLSINKDTMNSSVNEYFTTLGDVKSSFSS
ncbi:phosphoenolpyruvate--protein phosphotransferase [Flavivirga jejuensis]|uniref:Phosphoenolpyruvate--protein phosphotransferase n=1 Tax=Flavivirga jejuensis TaxID=870487 RepID=A0ABT8WKG3_9FLAO|nr:phosphoenolpyruvate--protein phosphotransferase [Flavivirga jejuensis]MDO5973652.1 phosphoenolpyruvate--protein phosphotransferase [Flavivirga jejuensis]